MHKKLSLVTAGLLAAGAISVGAASPAYACDEIANDPVYNWVCSAVHDAPDVKETINYYYYVVGETAMWAVCTAWPDLCP